MFFLVNKTKPKIKVLNDTKWPPMKDLKDFAKPGDTLEIVKVKTIVDHYGLVPYIRQGIEVVDCQRVNNKGTGFTDYKQRARDWIKKMQENKDYPLPTPECSKCNKLSLIPSDISSILETGKCAFCS